MKRQEGFIDVTGGKVWYEIVGNGNGIPLLTLHGGPGYPHDYLEPLEELSNSRQVIFYDQLGCGNSEKPTDKKLWTVERFVTEVGEVIEVLKLETYHILGQSWGAGLGTAFALTKPRGLKSLILSNPYLSTPQWQKDAHRLLKQLPQNMQDALKRGDTESQEYKHASSEFYFRFIYGFKDYPTPVLRADYKMNFDLYNYMWGPSEFQATGTLKDYDLIPKLSEITIPVLLICGRFDEATPESCEYFKNLLPNAQLKVLEKSAHFSMWTEKEEYLKTIKTFLQNFKN